MVVPPVGPVSDDDLPYGPGTIADAGSDEAWEARTARYAMGHREKRTAAELQLGDLVWHNRTLLYRPVVGVRYGMDARWEIQLQGGHSTWRPNRTSDQGLGPDQVWILVGAGDEYLRRSNGGLGAPPAS